MELLDRYRQALETAVEISCRYNVPPLPGRTVIMISSNLDYNETLKQDFCLPPDPDQNDNTDDEDEETNGRRRGRGKKKDEDKLSPTVRTWIPLISANSKGV